MDLSTVKRIRQEATVNGRVCTPGKKRVKKYPNTNPDEFTKSAIRHYAHNYYIRNEYPTFSNLLNSLVQADLFQGFLYFPQNYTTCFGFSFQNSKLKGQD